MDIQEPYSIIIRFSNYTKIYYVCGVIQDDSDYTSTVYFTTNVYETISITIANNWVIGNCERTITGE